eukprot:TRINITY_DN14103_c0_g1_i1.p1 TRINITY_DN14103_c0_g1~~TRINITY_DN14103_c0_g1_i1.p1  ORF type:complete len:144 (-),score=50.10 TRINITY_DN14103_c0_g1_i1:541-972(-)
MPLDPALKDLQIKVGTVKRTLKEYQAYLREEVDQRARIEKMKEDGKEEADIKKQMEVLNETLTMIPDAKQRCSKYANELSSFLAANCKDVGLAGDQPADTEEAEVKLVLESRDLLRKVDEALGTTTADQEPSSAADGPDVGDF